MRRRSRSKAIIRSVPLSLSSGPYASLLFVFLACLGIAVSSYAPQKIDGLRAQVSDGFAPALSFVAKPIQDASMFVRNVTGLASIQTENQALRQENLRLRQWYQTAMTLQFENKNLRTLMNVEPEAQQSFITARVLSDSGYAFAKSILVMAGQDDGVAKGQPVLSGEGVIGRITEAGDTASRILLLTDINSRVPVLVGNSGHHAILAGQNDDQPHIEHLPDDVQLMDGARIITSGQGGVFPYGLSVGTLKIGSDGQLRVQLFADFNRMLYVRIIDAPRDSDFRLLSPE